jgi:CD2 antigen cytoplasmic tail-binding protein 2
MTSRESRKRKSEQGTGRKQKRRRTSASRTEEQQKSRSNDDLLTEEGAILPGGLEDEGPPLKEGEGKLQHETKILEDEEAADIAEKIRKKKWKQKKHKLGLEDDKLQDKNAESDSDYSFSDPEKPVDFAKLGEADPEQLVNETGDRIEPFNLTEELEEGKFEADGNYVWNPTGKRRQLERLAREREALKERQRRFAEADTRPSDDRDGNRGGSDESSSEEEAADRAWFEEVERRAHEDKDYYNRIRQHPAPLLREDDTSTDVDTVALRRELLLLLKPHENVLSAMRRLKPKGSTKHPTKRGHSADDNATQSMDENEVAFTALVEKADILLNNGFPNIYSDTREQIEASLPQEENPASRQSSLSSFSTTTATGSESASLSVPSSNGNATTLWEYKWNAEDTNVYGPFDMATMLAWLSQGAFGDGTQVRVRRFGAAPEKAEFVPLIQVDWTR